MSGNRWKAQKKSRNRQVITVELFQPQMGQFTYWTSTVPVIGAQFRVHVLWSKHSSE